MSKRLGGIDHRLQRRNLFFMAFDRVPQYSSNIRSTKTVSRRGEAHRYTGHLLFYINQPPWKDVRKNKDERRKEPRLQFSGWQPIR